MYFTNLFSRCFYISKYRDGNVLCVVILILLAISSISIADTTENAETVVEEVKKKSPIIICGALRANYVYGTYTDGRGEDFGDVDLEILRLNADIDFNNIIGRIEYRWYPRYFGGNSGYSMIHTGWLGYNLADLGTIKAGIVRVPFGPTAYGVSTSWFFDQHFYVGLADDPDLGIRWDTSFDKLNLGIGYFLMSEPQTLGSSLASSRYGYDIVKWEETADSEGKVTWGDKENGYDEQHQLNLRAIYSLADIADVGASFQFGLLKGTNVGVDDSGNHYALSAHMKNSLANFTLYSQFTYYNHNITDDTPWNTGDLIPMGAYNFAWPVASEGIIPALSLRYDGIPTDSISWLNSVTPYVEWSTILKSVEDYNSSTLVTIGASWTIRDSLYLYSDIGLSNGNSFVGHNTSDGEKEDYANIFTGAGDVGANGNNYWNWRLNLNFGYYF